jgi:serine/threonine protein kinase/DNA-binding beta-propeller fold protein YncE
MPDIAVAGLRLLNCARGHFWETPVADNGAPRHTACPECGAPPDEIDLAPSEPLPTAITPLPPPITDKAGKPNVVGYEILEDMGRGPAGVALHRARQVSVGRVVVLETVLAREDPSQQAWGALRGEAAALARIPHPNIVAIYESGERDRQLFYNAVELVEGPTLASLIAGKPMPVAQVLALGEVLARALHYAHEKNVVHRCLKPDRIRLLVQRSDKKSNESNEPPACTVHNALCIPKIGGFGLAKAKMVEGDVTDQELQDRFPSYLAPEQAWGRIRDIGAPTDIWALGTILYECLTGQPAFKGSSPATTLEQIQSIDPLPLTKFRNDVPSNVAAVLRRALTRHPRRRYASAREMADDLRLAALGRPTKAREANIFVRSGLWAKRSPMAFVALGALLFAVIGILWAISSGNSRAKDAEIERDITRREMNQVERDRDGFRQQLRELKSTTDQASYLTQFGRAELEFHRGRAESARQILDRCRPEDRGIEWYLLRQQVDRSPGRPVTTLSVRVSGVTWSPDGQYVAACGDRAIRTFRVGFDAPGSDPLNVPAQPRQIAYSSRNVLLWLGDQSFTAWDPNTQQPLFTHTPRFGAISHFAVTPDGKTVLLTEPNGALSRIDIAGGGRAEVVRNGDAFNQGQIYVAPLNADGTNFAIVRAQTLNQLMVVEARSNTFVNCNGAITALCSNVKTQRLATAVNDGTIHIWKPPFGGFDPNPADPMMHEGRVIHTVTFTQDGRRLVSSGDDGAIRVWDPATSKEIFSLKTGEITSALAISPQGNRLVVGVGREVKILGTGE